MYLWMRFFAWLQNKPRWNDEVALQLGNLLTVFAG